jgi:2'-5' RNA ligase
MVFPRGETAVMVPVPAVEPLVRRWRERYDSSAPFGVPAHVTLLYPFLPWTDIDSEVAGRLGALCAGQPVFEVTFRRPARFPSVLYLAPEPAEPFRRLTAAIVARWPEYPPYGGVHDDPTPHLTIADDADDPTMMTIEAEVRPRLPVSTTVDEASLIVFDGVRWVSQLRLPFGRVDRWDGMP